MGNKKKHLVHGLTDFRRKLTESIVALQNGDSVEVIAYGLDRKRKGTITLTYKPFDESAETN